MDYSTITGDRYAVALAADGTPTITVTSNAEYVAAVAALKATGGTIKVDTSDGAFRLDLNRIWNSEYIVVTSADPENPATILGMNISKISNMTFTGLSFETGDPLNKSGHAVHMQNTTDIAFVGNTITGSVTGRLGIEDTEKAGGAIYMSGVTNTVLADNTITAVSMGISTIRSENTLIQGNVLTELQMDVMRIVSSIDTVVDRNVVDRLFGSTATENHDDILQYWQVNGSEIIRNLTVTNNYFNAGDASYQGIFGGGGMKDTGGATGLVIDNNLIITGGTIHGITANYFTDARITNNTILNNADALNFATPDSVGTSSYQPGINLFQLENVEVSGNIGFVRDADPQRNQLSGDIVIENNIGVDYADVSSPFYVDNLFVNAGTGGVKDLRDFQAIDGSIVDGVGSSLTDIGDAVTLGMRMSQSSAFAQVFDFSVHAPQSGVSYVWTTDDGRTFAGTHVSILFEQTGLSTVTLAATGPDGEVETVSRDVTSVSAMLFDFDPETGFPLADAGTGKDTHMTAGDPELTMSQDGTRMVMSLDRDDQFGVNRHTTRL